MQEVADVLVRHQHAWRAAIVVAGISFVQRVQPLSGSPERQMQVQEGMGKPGHVGGDCLQILPVRHQTAEDGIGQRFAEIVDELFAVFMRKGADIDGKALRQRHHDLRRQRPLIVLDLIEVAGGDAEAIRERALVQALPIAQSANFQAGENLLAHCLLVTLQIAVAKNLQDRPIQPFPCVDCRYLSIQR